MKKNISVSEASKICSVSRSTIWRWIKSGKIKASKTAGGHHRIKEPDLQAFMDDQQMHPQYRNAVDKKILIVDDDEMIRRFFKRFLDRPGLTLAFAKDGFEAGIKVMAFKPDLIILDLILPNMDGFSVCEQIRQSPEAASIKIIAISGYDNEINRKRILAAGADAFIPKPIDTQLMLERIDQLLSISLLKTG